MQAPGEQQGAELADKADRLPRFRPSRETPSLPQASPYNPLWQEAGCRDGSRRAGEPHLAAIQQMNKVTVIDEKALNECLNEITRALLQSRPCSSRWFMGLQQNVEKYCQP